MKKFQNTKIYDYNYLDIAELDDGVALNQMENAEMDEELEVQNISQIYIVHMDIRQPLSLLRTLLEQCVQCALENFSFYLQGQKLDPNINLVDQCVEGRGLVQINCQINIALSKIYIVDVLRPTDDVLAKSKPPRKKLKPDPESLKSQQSVKNENDNYVGCEELVATAEPENGESSFKWNTHWAIDNSFKREQMRLKIPEQPSQWSEAHVRFWLQWAIREFSLANIKPAEWSISGERLCQLSQKDFKQLVPLDPGDIFWTHFELLRKCKYVAVLKKNVPSPCSQSKRINGSNGQIQLWQFLLDILTSYEHRSIIQWVGFDGEFKLKKPDMVAQMWGLRKNKPTMNYEKLSRSLRYYYDYKMISKVPGQRFVYKFVCDLQSLIGYNARELAMLVSEQM